jgi:hypothetical protein
MAKSTRNDVAAIAAEDGHAIVGGRPGEGVLYRDTASFGAPLLEEHRKRSAVKARLPQESPTPDYNALPMLGVARAAAGKEITRLRGVEAAIERELSRGVIGATGAPVPHLIQRAAEHRAELEHVRSEIEMLSAMSDDAVRLWAYEHGAR